MIAILTIFSLFTNSSANIVYACTKPVEFEYSKNKSGFSSKFRNHDDLYSYDDQDDYASDFSNYENFNDINYLDILKHNLNSGKHHHHRHYHGHKRSNVMRQRHSSAFILPRYTLKNSAKNLFLINHLTDENGYNQKYTKKYKDSKLYAIKAKYDTEVDFLLLSHEKEYFPQMEVASSLDYDETYKTKEPFRTEAESNSKTYKVKKGENILIEIGYDEKLDTDYFKNKNREVRFSLLFSTARKLAITDYFNKGKVKAREYDVSTEFIAGKGLYLGTSFINTFSHGSLDLKLTPYYNQDNESIAIFYTHGATNHGVSEGRSSIVEQKCSSDSENIVFDSIQTKSGHYIFSGSGNKTCDLNDLLAEFKVNKSK